MMSYIIISLLPFPSKNHAPKLHTRSLPMFHRTACRRALRILYSQQLPNLVCLYPKASSYYSLIYHGLQTVLLYQAILPWPRVRRTLQESGAQSKRNRKDKHWSFLGLWLDSFNALAKKVVLPKAEHLSTQISQCGQAGWFSNRLLGTLPRHSVLLDRGD